MYNRGVSSPDSIGRYEILREIGHRGLASVYEARDPRSGEGVIVKLCTGGDKIVRERFLAQAERNAGLEHSHIQPVVDLGRMDSAPFLAESPPGGPTLEALISGHEPMAELRRMEILLEVAMALEYAHSQGVLHGGLAAECVQLADDGAARVGDFGLTRYLTSVPRDAGAPGEAESSWPSLAPEQALGREPDGRSDIFCFGVLAFRLLTCGSPYDAESVEGWIAAIVGAQAKSVKTVWPGCPADLANLIDRCLKKDPEARPAGFLEVISELSTIIRSPVAETVPALVLRFPGGSEPDGGDEADAVPNLPESPADPGESSRAGSQPRPSALVTAAARRVARAGRQGWTRFLGLSPRGRGVVVVATVGAVLLAVLLALSAVGGDSDPGIRPVERPEPLGAAVPPPPASALPAAGWLVVDARPWGTVVSLTDADGAAVTLGEDRSTPLALALAPGVYEAVVSGGEAEEPQVCRVEVRVDATVECAVDRAPVDVEEYFREAGWWR